MCKPLCVVAKVCCAEKEVAVGLFALLVALERFFISLVIKPNFSCKGDVYWYVTSEMRIPGTILTVMVAV